MYVNHVVDHCFIPESPFYLEGVAGQFGNKLLQYMSLRISQKLRSLVYVPFMVQGQGIQASQLALLIGDMLKCLYPVYMIWAVPSNASNNLCCIPLCTTFHGARAGYTSFTVSPINRRHAYIPYHP
nr:atp-dependent 6-phosphofructokinase 1 [Quercus suber]